MPSIDLNKDVRSLRDFKRRTRSFVSELRRSGHPLVLTIHGKAELVAQDAGAYQQLLDELDELQAIEGIRNGLTDVAAGRVTELGDFESEFRSRNGLPHRSCG